MTPPIPRRAFLQATAATVGLAALGSIKVRAASKSGLGPVTVGSGEHTYECLHDWAQLPKTIAFGNTHGVAVDRAGNLHIKHTVHATSSSPDAMCVFDPDGKFIRSWGAEFKGGAHGLTLSREIISRDTDTELEYLFLADCQKGVVKKTTLAGELVLDVPWPEQSGLYNSKAEYKPTNIAVVPHAPRNAGELWRARQGHFYVADGYGKSWIHEYSAVGEYLRSFGGPGKERGQVSCPHGIAIDSRMAQPDVTAAEPHIIVADRSNRRIQKFSLDGRHHGFVTSELRSPCHFDQRGQLLLVPDLEARVTLLNEKNELVAHLGDGANFALRDKPRDQFLPGKFIAPHSACFDKDGNIFVVEWVEVGRVTKLRKVS